VRRKRSTLTYEVPPPPPGQVLGETMFQLTTALAGTPRLSVTEWRRRCDASLRASRARRGKRPPDAVLFIREPPSAEVVDVSIVRSLP